MSTATFDYQSETGQEDDNLQYRALHAGALIGLLLGVISICVVIIAPVSLEACLLSALIPAVGILVSKMSLSKIQKYPDQYTGALPAQFGLALSILFLFGGVAYGVYIYSTEVPDGYSRISFNSMKPDELQERGGIAVPPEIAALDGKKVFIKGYIRPGSSPVRTNIDSFLLVRDNNQCCFGDLSKVKYYDQMVVKITSGRRVDDNLQILNMGGILEVHPENLASGAPVFSLKADYAVQ